MPRPSVNGRRKKRVFFCYYSILLTIARDCGRVAGAVPIGAVTIYSSVGRTEIRVETFLHCSMHCSVEAVRALFSAVTILACSDASCDNFSPYIISDFISISKIGTPFGIVPSMLHAFLCPRGHVGTKFISSPLYNFVNQHCNFAP